jgi:cyclic dehypoxanthinyl futalosine synthase
MHAWAIEAKVERGDLLTVAEAAALWQLASDDTLSQLATRVRDRLHPPGVATWLVMAIVNYTNICVARCDYCAFYRLPRDPEGYLLDVDQVTARIEALRSLGGTLVAFNGGFHPKLKLLDYAVLFEELRRRFPDLVFFDMTVAEFMYSCKVSRLSYTDGAQLLGAHGVQWVTGGGAEVLTESFRQRHSPLKYGVEDFYDAQRAILGAGLGSTATMVIGFDESLAERLAHLERLRRFQEEVGGALPSFLCWTYKPWNTALGGTEVPLKEYVRWLAISRLFLTNFDHIRTSVLTRNEDALLGLRYGADDFDLPTEDEVTETAGATISLDFEGLLGAARRQGYEPVQRTPFPVSPVPQPERVRGA